MAFVTAYNPTERIRGGIESHVLSLSEAFAACGAKTYVFTMGKVSVVTKTEVRGVNYVVLPDAGFESLVLRSLRFGLLGKRAIEESESKYAIDFLIGEAGHASPLIWAKLRHARQVLTVHTGERYGLKVAQLDLRSTKFWRGVLNLVTLPILRVWRYLYLSRAVGLVYVSKSAKDEVEMIYSKLKVKLNAVIPNGVDQPIPGPVSEATRFDLAFVGRLERVKGADLFLESLLLLAQNGVRPSIAVVGEGPYSKAFERTNAQLGAHGAWTLFGYIEKHAKIIEVMRGAKFLVVPSIVESDPIVIKEAFAAGVPVICFKTDQLAALYPDSEVIYAGSPNAQNLARTLEEVLSWTDSKYANYALSIRQRSPRASWADVAREYLRFLDRLPRPETPRTRKTSAGGIDGLV